MEPQMEHDRSIDPEASPPRMFGGLVGSGKLSWMWAMERLSRARTYWIATTRPSGQPHSRPVWGVWLDAAFLVRVRWQPRISLLYQPSQSIWRVEAKW
jgi:hypothetical protein